MIVGKEVYSLSRLPKRVRRSIISSLCTLASFLALTTYGVYGAAFQPVMSAQAGSTLNVWWPSDGKHVQGLQPFKAMVEGLTVEQYDMSWQVDGGALVAMDNSYTDYPHKEAPVDVSTWNWHGAGPYAIHMVAKQNGSVISEATFNIYVDGKSVQTATAQPTVLAMNANVPAASSQQSQPSPVPAPTPTQSQPQQQPVSPSQPVTVWWPSQGATLSNAEPFKAVVGGLPTDQYDMYWSVDNGGQVLMKDNATGGIHKEAIVDVSGWSWRGAGPYYLTFTAKDKNGNTISDSRVQVNVQSAAASQPQTSSSAFAAQTVQSATPLFTVSLSQPTVSVSGSDPISGLRLYVNQNSNAASQANSWSGSDAQAMRLLANQPTAVWYGNWTSNVFGDVSSLMSSAVAQNAAPVMVVYNIPGRDCSGGYSSGGSTSADQYRAWISSMASAIGSKKAVVILEPDALADLSCLSQNDQDTRLSLLSYAVSTLKQGGHTAVYLDAGHAGWVAPSAMAANLRKAGVSQADGFSVNVSNFDTTDASRGYGEQISQLLGGTHYVIDTSRNGTGSNGQWCNPSGRAIGQTPTASTGNAHVDAYLWLKTPGESDGTCNGGPNAGTWWASYALQLVRNAGL